MAQIPRGRGLPLPPLGCFDTLSGQLRVSGSSRYIHLRPSTAASPNSRGGGFSNARGPAEASGRDLRPQAIGPEPLSGGVRDGLPQPPSAAKAIPLQQHGCQGRAAVASEPYLDLEDLHVHAA